MRREIILKQNARKGSQHANRLAPKTAIAYFFLQCLQIDRFMNLKYIHFAKTNENELSFLCLQGLLIYGLRKCTVAYFMI